MNEIELKNKVAENILKYRKKNNYTQATLSEKLYVSDKAISKWERAESLPDIFMLQKLSEVFGIELDELIGNEKKNIELETNSEKDSKSSKKEISHKKIIPYLAYAISWLGIIIIGIVLGYLGIDKYWLSFIYGVPISSVVLLVFYVLDHKYFHTMIAILVIIITTVACIFLTFYFFASTIQNQYLIFIVSGPLCVLNILWYYFQINKPKNKIK
ncbi:MAG: helix-turn-helix domain-containing protein [Acholeplasmatales bacterium]|jgi:transcriptional regulator with XRE-family HTH domain|nr:helix-turn-helix domain-containing protein [Acholeplasmatales bacterium]